MLTFLLASVSALQLPAVFSLPLWSFRVLPVVLQPIRGFSGHVMTPQHMINSREMVSTLVCGEIKRKQFYLYFVHPCQKLCTTRQYNKSQ